jgi:hypothetical protein
MFKISEGSHFPTAHSADEREHSRTAMRISGMQDRQPLILGEANVAKRVHKRGQLGGSQRGSHLPNIEQRSIHSAQSTGFRQLRQHGTTGDHIEFALAAHAKKFRSPNNLKFKRHG